MKVISVFQKYATGRLVLLSLLLTTIVYLIIVFYSIPAVTRLAPEIKLFDMLPGGYDFIYAEELLTSIGAEGRNTYLKLQIPIDFLYPILFAWTYTLMLVWIFGKRLNKDSKLFFLTLLPVLAGLFDYFENFGVIFMLSSFPSINLEFVQISSLFTIFKSICTVTSYVLLLFGLLLLILRSKHD